MAFAAQCRDAWPILAALKAKFRRPAAIPFPAANPVFGGKARARRAAVPRQASCRPTAASPARPATIRAKGFADGREHGDRRARTPARRATRRPCGISAWARRCSGTAARAAWRSRSPARSSARRDGPADGSAGRAACAPTGLRARLRQGVSASEPQRHAKTIWPRRSRPTSARWCRRRRVSIAGSRATTRRCRRRRSQASGCSPARPAAPTATRLGVHRLRFLRHRPARATTAAAARYCVCRPPTTRSRRRDLRELERSRALHARRLARDPRRRGAALRARYCRTRRRVGRDLVRELKLSEAGARRLARLSRRRCRAKTIRGRPRRSRRETVRPTRAAARGDHDFAARQAVHARPTSRIRRGAHLWVLNNDTRTHNVRMFDPKLDFDSGAQEPGETVEIAFPGGRLIPGVLRHPSQDGTVCGRHQIRLKTPFWCAPAGLFWSPMVQTFRAYRGAPRLIRIPCKNNLWEKRMKRRQFLKVAGVGACRGRGRQARDRPIDAGTEMAADLELSRNRSTRFTAPPRCSPRRWREATDNKFQIQVFAAGEIVPGLQAADAVQQRHRRDVPHRVLLLFRQGSDVRVRHCGSVRPQHPHAERLDVFRRRHAT